VKTFFNILGPTANPSQPQKQLSGVYNLELSRLYGHLFYEVFERFAIVHSLDCYDEISLTSDFKLITHQNESVVAPEQLGVKKLNQQDLYGGESVADAIEIFKKIIGGSGTQAQNDVVVANAGLAIWVANTNRSLMDCIGQARESLLMGNAKRCFDTFLSINS
ncbi:MAG TPA: hypothetical protein VL947_06040, partial [Cytophagales bacterium]|nr:hypothetical protein [Cytophagales bacterium]